jgi:hypothetical protein
LCSFLHSIFGGSQNRQEVFEFFTKFNSVNWVRLNYTDYSPIEKSFLWVCYFFYSENSEHFRKRNRWCITVAGTEFQAEHEYRNRLFQFAEIEFFLPVPFVHSSLKRPGPQFGSRTATHVRVRTADSYDTRPRPSSDSPLLRRADTLTRSSSQS